MSMPQAVAAYVDARLAADAAPVWARLSSEDEAAHRMRELLAACFGASVALDDALIAHAPDFVRAQAERWRGMVGLLAPVKEPEPIVVLGPWEVWPWGTSYRHHVSSRLPSACVYEDCYSLYDAAESPIVTAPGSRDGADAEMRKRGWVLLDAAPLAQPRALGPWVEKCHNVRERFCSSVALYASVGVYWDGWRVYATAGELSAHGPQTGPEGERLALAAAYALGFVEGT